MQMKKTGVDGKTRLRLPIVKSGFFYKPLHPEPESIRLSIVEYDEANNRLQEYRYNNRSKEEAERAKGLMNPDMLFAKALRKLFDRKTAEEVGEALEDISLSRVRGVDIGPALEDLHSLKTNADYWPMASLILAEHYLDKGRADKIVELLGDNDPLVRMAALDCLTIRAKDGADISFVVELAYSMTKDIEQMVAESASKLVICCALSKNSKVKEAFLRLRERIKADYELE